MIDTTQAKDLELFDTIAVHYSKKDAVPSSQEARKYQLLTGMGNLLSTNLGSLLEIGCGIGASAKYLDGKFTNYTGIDYSAEQVRYAKAAHVGKHNVTFEVENVKDINPRKYPLMDTVLAVGAFHHFTELDLVFTAICSVMKPGARIIAIEPQRGNPVVQFLRYVRTKIDKHYSDEQMYFSASELKLLFIHYGFSDVEIQYEGFFSPPLAQVILYPQWFFLPISRLTISMDRLCDLLLPAFLKRLSWNIVVRARFTGAGTYSKDLTNIS